MSGIGRQQFDTPTYKTNGYPISVISLEKPKTVTRTLSLENMVFGCSSCVLDLHVRLARAVRHISFRSEKQKALCQSFKTQSKL